MLQRREDGQWGTRGPRLPVARSIGLARRRARLVANRAGSRAARPIGLRSSCGWRRWKASRSAEQEGISKGKAAAATYRADDGAPESDPATQRVDVAAVPGPVHLLRRGASVRG